MKPINRKYQRTETVRAKEGKEAVLVELVAIAVQEAVLQQKVRQDDTHLLVQ